MRRAPELRQQQGNRQQTVKSAKTRKAFGPTDSAHSIPTAASSHSNIGKPPAAVCTSRRTIAIVKVGSNATSQRTRRIDVADVDHGRDTTTATATQSANWARRLRSSFFVNNAVSVSGRPQGSSADIRRARLSQPCGLHEHKLVGRFAHAKVLRPYDMIAADTLPGKSISRVDDKPRVTCDQ
jgi:hypothetical protein